jgi:hypothetical protein
MDDAMNRRETLVVSAQEANSFGWMRSVSFDAAFIVGVMTVALLSGWLCVVNPKLFPVILLLDVWILGYHHVVATFTRLAFDLESYRENKFLITWLPVIVVVLAVAATLALGAWILASVYLYWQWFHYTRQAYGIARIYYRKSNPAHSNRSSLLEQLTIYTVPLYGILYRSWQNPQQFLGMELRVLPTPYWVVRLAGIASVLVVVWWLARQFVAYKRGEMKPGYTLFMLSHLVVFMTGYIFIEEINYGWLCLNVWHNAQYVLLVWLFNNNRFKNGIDPRHKFLSMISQTKYIYIYYAVCVCISTVLYASANKILGLISFTAFPLALLFYQTVNFHHYVVDGIIWKSRRKQISNSPLL